MSLPAILEELAARLPERVRVFHNDTDPTDVWVTHVEVKYEGWRDVWWGGDMPRWNQAWALEGMLREECEARGWTWTVEYVQPGNYWSHIDRPDYRHGFGSHGAATPAEALAVALLVALASGVSQAAK